jgi:hypothetical protein
VTGKFGQIIINDKKTLLKEITTMLPYTTIHLIGPSGSGKTSLVESLINIKELEIDELKIVRLQGVSSEDFRLPVVKTIKKNFSFEEERKVVELINMGIFQEILDNPDKKYLVFFDELLRADSSITPLLFGLLERRINGIKVPNMLVMCSSNYGEEYISNFDFSDSALRRRQIFIEYKPSKDDILDFMKENRYSDILISAISDMKIEEIISHGNTNLELEQDTQLGSWSLLNDRWKKLKIETFKAGRLDISKYGEYFFSSKTKKKFLNNLTLLEQLDDIDVHNQIIVNKGLENDKDILNQQGEIINKTIMLTELKIRTKKFIINQTLNIDENYFLDYFDDILQVFKNDTLLFIILIEEFKERAKGNNKNKSIWRRIAVKILKEISETSELGKSLYKVTDLLNLKV